MWYKMCRYSCLQIESFGQTGNMMIGNVVFGKNGFMSGNDVIFERNPSKMQLKLVHTQFVEIRVTMILKKEIIRIPNKSNIE